MWNKPEVEYNLNNKGKKIINSDFIVKEYPYTNGFIPLVYDGCTFHYGIISEGLKINKVVESNSFVVVYESEKMLGRGVLLELPIETVKVLPKEN